MLGARVLSALVMAPVALVAVWWGAVGFTTLASLCGAVMMWEWDHICRRRFGRGGGIGALAVSSAAALALTTPFSAVAVVCVVALALAVFSRSGWLAFGVAYVGLPAVALVWIRCVAGAQSIFWLLGVVWATDIGAYAFGRTIGGPKLAPRASPAKTWAGVAGGVVCAAGVGAAAPIVLERPDWIALAVFAAALSIAAQIGDLFESSVKRRFNVKDSSTIIPGHGGVLDRLDGLLAAAPLMALAVLAAGGGLGTWP